MPLSIKGPPCLLLFEVSWYNAIQIEFKLLFFLWKIYFVGKKGFLNSEIDTWIHIESKKIWKLNRLSNPPSPMEFPGSLTPYFSKISIPSVVGVRIFSGTTSVSCFLSYENHIGTSIRFQCKKKFSWLKKTHRNKASPKPHNVLSSGHRVKCVKHTIGTSVEQKYIMWWVPEVFIYFKI